MDTAEPVSDVAPIVGALNDPEGQENGSEILRNTGAQLSPETSCVGVETMCSLDTTRKFRGVGPGTTYVVSILLSICLLDAVRAARWLRRHRVGSIA
eukprot:scaffold265341_cov35-Tisochrysis_lutea.AAC.2